METHKFLLRSNINNIGSLEEISRNKQKGKSITSQSLCSVNGGPSSNLKRAANKLKQTIKHLQMLHTRISIYQALLF
jgi:hypothetical protein